MNQTRNLVSLELAVDKNQMVTEEIVIEDDDLEEIEIAEDERLHLKNVSSLVEAAYQRVERYSRDRPNQFVIASAAVSERSSCASTYHHAASLPESLDGGKGEVKDFIGLPTTFESALRMNQALQRRFTATLTRLEKTLEENLKRQSLLKEETEEQSIIASIDKENSDARLRYTIRPSSFAIPYFKERFGIPAPMNADAKYKVDHGYTDLYTTKSRTWLTVEHKTLLTEVRKEWKRQQISGCKELLRNSERKLKNNDISRREKKLIDDEISACQNRITYLEEEEAEEIEIPKDSKIDWNAVAANAFDGDRTPEECQQMWENYLHPSINKDPWTEEEDITIQNCVLKSDVKPQWAAIAEKLNSGRTSFQVMSRWVSFIKPTLQPARWTPEISKKLEDTVNMIRVGNHISWTKVAQHFLGYSKGQLQSRWKNIDPEQARGPFTEEEDFILIKGLIKFGMNFALIAHFMPGRSRYQVRNRFKRAILPGLAYKPWNCTEDKKIMANCSMASQHWRRMALVLPKRDTCEIRLRFYILHMWQALSKQKVLPPPLYPLSMTKKPKEIKELRDKIVKLNPDVRLVLDKISSEKLSLEPSIKSLEERRAAVGKRRRSATLANLLKEKKDEHRPRVIKKVKRRPHFNGRVPSWPDMALTEFFLPGRLPLTADASQPNNADLRTSENFHRISQALQLKLTRSADWDDQRLTPLNFTDQDFELINGMVVEHNHAERDEDEECEACLSKVYPEVCPIFPPNLSSVGAFRSLLLHKHKLKEMASKEFLLCQVPSDQLQKLGDKPNTMISKIVKEEPEVTEEQLNSLSNSDNVENSNVSQNSSDSDDSSVPKYKRKAAEKAKLKTLILAKKDLRASLSQKSVNTPDAINLPTEDELKEMLLASELTEISKNAQSDDPCKTIAEEDKLLFQRMLSIFFWPTLFTMQRPNMETYHISNDLVQELKFNQMDTEDTIFDPFDETKGHGKMHHLNIKEHERLIKLMELKKKVPRKLRKKLIEEEQIRRNKILEAGGSLSDFDEIPDEKIMDKKSITKLKRSLVMKKLWDQRRKGIKPERKRRENSKGRTILSSRSRRQKNLVETADDDDDALDDDLENTLEDTIEVDED